METLTFKQLNILLADDDIDDCLFFKEALEALPVITKLKVVYDGDELMNYLTDNKAQLPHVLFLDINMPRKNGFECLIEIKQHKNLSAMPVVIFSTSYEQEVVNLLYKNGAQYFIRKPPEFRQFKKIIFHVLTLITQDLLNGRVRLPAAQVKNNVQPAPENFVLTVENILTI